MIELGKQYKTRDGREVRIYAVDGAEMLTVHGAIKLDDAGWELVAWRSDGRIGSWQETDSDLIEVKPRIQREVWANVYKNPNIGDILFPSKEEANNCKLYDRIACVKLAIDCEEGEGL
jgi:hypothetical protein